MIPIKVLPIFIPHAGCKHRCTFCNQNIISGLSDDAITFVRKQVDENLHWFKPESIIELAFYGGSFTALKLDLQEELLAYANNLMAKNIIHSIRLSTRPDCIDDKIILLLKKYNVRLVELGVQSFDNKVLNLARRGYMAEVVEKSVDLLHQANIEVGIQLMVGMEGQNWQSIVDAVRQTIRLQPNVIRIYPVVVLSGTELSRRYLAGSYKLEKPSTILAQASFMLDTFTNAGLNVIRIGLQADDVLLSSGSIVAGYFSSAFGEEVQSHIWRWKIAEHLDHLSQETTLHDISTLTTNKIYLENILAMNLGKKNNSRKNISTIIGHKKINIKYWQNNWRKTFQSNPYHD